MASADALLVNSQFTADVVRNTFPNLASTQINIAYPPVDLDLIRTAGQRFNSWSQLTEQFPTETQNLKPKQFVLSLNRYEKKKQIDLAVEAIAWIKANRSTPEVPKLVIAGGFDLRVDENAQVLQELQMLAAAKGLKENEDVIFLKSIAADLRWGLLLHAQAVLYTPANEHFGIVPIEAMALGTPVIARRSGGPKESIADGTTGYLCDDDVDAQGEQFGKALIKILSLDNNDKVQLRNSCQERVKAMFGLGAFSVNLSEVINEALNSGQLGQGDKSE